MARIRSVHPGLFTDEAFAQLSDSAQIFWIGLWTEADDQGVFEWKPITLKMKLRGASISPVDPLLEELEKLNCVKRFSFEGRNYGAIRNFCRFQRPKKPNSIHPIPPEFRTYTRLDCRSSEPDDDEGVTSSPPVPHQPHVNGHAILQKGENPAQRKEEGGRRKEGKEKTSLRSDADASPMPPDARSALWVKGVEAVHRMTGKPERACKTLIGKWAKDAKDDCAMLNAIIADCVEVRPGDPVAWITAGITARMKPPDKHAWLDAIGQSPQFDLEATRDDEGNYQV